MLYYNRSKVLDLENLKWISCLTIYQPCDTSKIS
jgi:hypothetical protein